MQGVIDADTHISEGAAMWALMDQAMQPRRPIMLSVSDDTWYGDRNAFWLIDGEIYPKPAGKGSFALVTIDSGNFVTKEITITGVSSRQANDVDEVF